MVENLVDGVVTSTYDTNNRLLKSEALSGITTYTYDASGNRRTVEEPSGDITTSTWDAQNHLVRVELPSSEIVTYTWAPINKANEERLVQRDDGVDVRRYLWDNNNVLRETDDLGAVETQSTYAPQPYGDLISQHQDGDSTFHQYDALGSTTGLTDESGVLTDTSRYEAFGKPVAETGSLETPYRWVGQQGYRLDDTTGDYNLRARDYDPQAARFLSPDPLGLDAGDSNFYRYVANSPVNNGDPSGEEPLTVLESQRLQQFQAYLWSGTRTEADAVVWIQQHAQTEAEAEELYRVFQNRILGIDPINRFDGGGLYTGNCLPGFEERRRRMKHAPRAPEPICLQKLGGSFSDIAGFVNELLNDSSLSWTPPITIPGMGPIPLPIPYPNNLPSLFPKQTDGLCRVIGVPDIVGPSRPCSDADIAAMAPHQKLAYAMVAAIPHLPAEIADALAPLFTVQAGLFFVGALAVSAIPGVGQVADAVLIAAFVVALGEAACEFLIGIGEFVRELKEARSCANMESAAKKLAETLASISDEAALLLVGYAGGRIVREVKGRIGNGTPTRPPLKPKPERPPGGFANEGGEFLDEFPAPNNTELDAARQRIAGQVEEVARRRSLGNDPKRGPLPYEEAAAIKLEQQEGIRLCRDKSGAADWIGPNNTSYDLLGPFPQKFLPDQIKNGKLLKAFQEHTTGPKTDFAVVDFSGLDATGLQQVESVISQLTPAQQARIIRLK